MISNVHSPANQMGIKIHCTNDPGVLCSLEFWIQTKCISLWSFRTATRKFSTGSIFLHLQLNWAIQVLEYIRPFEAGLHKIYFFRYLIFMFIWIFCEGCVNVFIRMSDNNSKTKLWQKLLSVIETSFCDRNNFFLWQKLLSETET